MQERTSQHIITRRSFLAGSTAVIAGSASAKTRHISPADKINLAVVGAGGRGADNLGDFKTTGAVNVVALCDADWNRAADSFKAYPDAKKYSDWRKMFDAEKNFDAVLVATPDHNHAIVSVNAMKLGKHVYCEKPLAHSIWEVRQMAKAAAEKGVATQMGTQGHAFEGTRRAVEVIRSGAIGDVKELHVWTDRPAGWWPQGVGRPSDTPAVPQGLDWDVWLGPAPERPFNPAYVPFKWRGFWDFGTGAIGDMGIHNLDTAYWGLELGVPTSVSIKDCSPALTVPASKETAPLWSILELHFPGRGKQPPVKMTWYDGGKLPPKELFQGEPIVYPDGGSLVIGSRGTLFTRTWHGGESKLDMFVLLPKKQFDGYKPPEKTLPRPASHHQGFVDACRGMGKTYSNFGYWDAAGMKAKGCPEADEFIKPAFRAGWTL